MDGSQRGLFDEQKTAEPIEVHYCPPDYPRALRPFNCPHGGAAEVSAAVTGHRKGWQYQHRMCMACGMRLESWGDGNVLATIVMLHGALGWNPKFSDRLYYLAQRWGRIARRLFGPAGWTGRHEKLARIIDRNLTMKITPRPHPSNSDLFGVSLDPEYFQLIDGSYLQFTDVKSEGE